MSHKVRLPYQKLAPTAFRKLLELSNTMHECSLGRRLVDLIFLRDSQINGCGYCADMHWRDLIAQGSDARELNTLNAWRESAFFSERERAALEWSEVITAAPAAGSDEAYAAMKQQFS